MTELALRKVDGLENKWSQLTFGWGLQILDHYMHLSFHFHTVFMTVALKWKAAAFAAVSFWDLLACEHAGEESSMGNRQREIISPLFIRPREISREVLLLVQYLSCKICSHRSTVSAGELVQAGAGLTAGRLQCQPQCKETVGWVAGKKASI